MNGEVIHSLLSLFYQSVTKQFPGQLLGLALDFLQSLVDRHSANRHRTVTNDPFAGFMDVLAGRQVHDGIGAPANAPGHLVHFFLNG